MLFARRLVLVLLLAVLSLAPARANPMLLVDMDNFDVLYAQDAGQPWHPASLTKMMTAYVAFEQIAAGRMTMIVRQVEAAGAVGLSPLGRYARRLRQAGRVAGSRVWLALEERRARHVRHLRPARPARGVAERGKHRGRHALPV